MPRPLQQVDVVIYYGDLTEESKLSELKTTIQLLKAINAPLETHYRRQTRLDTRHTRLRENDFRRQLPSRPRPRTESLRKVYGNYNSARQPLWGAKEASIISLDKRTYQFIFENSVSLLYAPGRGPSNNIWTAKGRFRLHVIQRANQLLRSLRSCRPHSTTVAQLWTYL